MTTREEVYLEQLLEKRTKGIPNPKEVGLVNALHALLTKVGEGEPLTLQSLEYCKNKVRKVCCFGLKYGHMVRYLERYHSLHQETGT